MLTKYFAKFEAWLRGIVRDEVSRVDTSLHREREALQSHLRVFDERIQSFNKACDRLVEMSYFKESAQLREHIRTLNDHFTEVRSTIEALHPRV